MVPIREVMVKSRGRGARRQAEEAAALRRGLPEGAWIVALERSGRQLGSEQLARALTRRRERHGGAIAFVVGSDLGLSAEFSKAADCRLSLGPLTLPHELARLVLVEQLYRALAIERGIKYHRGPLDPC